MPAITFPVSAICGEDPCNNARKQAIRLAACQVFPGGFGDVGEENLLSSSAGGVNLGSL
jgi:hypothetical protein